MSTVPGQPFHAKEEIFEWLKPKQFMLLYSHEDLIATWKVLKNK